MSNDFKNTVTGDMPDEKHKAGSAIPWLLEVVLFILVAMAAFYFFGTSCNHTENTATEEQASSKNNTEQVSTEMQSPVMAAGKVDSITGNFIYDMGKMVTIDLPNGAGKLEVGEFSTENKLCKFLADPNAAIDTVNGNWFEFTNVRFKAGGAVIDDASMAQLRNMVAISKGYPNAQFKIGGYTDNTGSAAGNIALSQKRADAVAAMLIKTGAVAKSIIGAKGYGPEHPIGDNNTVDGKAMNRRVAVNVKAK